MQRELSAPNAPDAVTTFIAFTPRLSRVVADVSAAISRDRAFVTICLTYWIGSVIVGGFVGWPGVVAAGLSYAQVAITSVAVFIGLLAVLGLGLWQFARWLIPGSPPDWRSA